MQHEYQAIKDKEMLIVLTHELVVEGQKIRMGGQLMKVIKHYSQELKALLGSISKADTSKDGVVYVRPNRHIENVLTSFID